MNGSKQNSATLIDLKHHWGGLRSPKPPCCLGGVRPRENPASTARTHEPCGTPYMYYGYSTCIYYGHSTCMHYCHSTCMYYGHSKCMYYGHSTCMYYGHSKCIMSYRAQVPSPLRRGGGGKRSPQSSKLVCGAAGPRMVSQIL